MKKIIRMTTALIFFFLLLLASSEYLLRSKYGVPPQEKKQRQFERDYIEIYKPFFRRAAGEKKDFYVSCREGSLAERFPAEKEPKAVRIFILGGSVAHDWSSWPRHFSLINSYFRRKTNGEKKLKIINCGMDGYDSYRVLLTAKEVLSYHPDFLIIISGNNEFYNKSGFNLAAYRFNKKLRKLWAYRKVQDNLILWMENKGMLRPRGRRKRLTDYKRNIEIVVDMAQKREVPVILCTLPVNFCRFSPPGPWPADERFLSGVALMENGKYAKAIKQLDIFLKKQPHNPFGYYYLGRVYEETKDDRRAKNNYLQAVELSAYSWHRASKSSNRILRRISREKRTGLVDLESLFMKISPDGWPGREIFYDRCHFWWNYYGLVEAALLKEIVGGGNESAANGPDSQMQRPKFPGKKSLLRILANNAGGEEVIYDWVVSMADSIHYLDSSVLDDFSFLRNFIKTEFCPLLCSNKSGCQKCFRHYYSKMLCYIGEFWRRKHRYRKALIYFNKAIDIRHDSYIPFLQKGMAYSGLKNRDKAEKSFKQAETKAGSLGHSHRYYVRQVTQAYQEALVFNGHEEDNR